MHLCKHADIVAVLIVLVDYLIWIRVSSVRRARNEFETKNWKGNDQNILAGVYMARTRMRRTVVISTIEIDRINEQCYILGEQVSETKRGKSYKKQQSVHSQSMHSAHAVVNTAQYTR